MELSGRSEQLVTLSVGKSMARHHGSEQGQHSRSETLHLGHKNPLCVFLRYMIEYL